MKKDLPKTPDVMYDFIYNLWFIYNELCTMRIGEKLRNVQKSENKEKILRLVDLPSPPRKDSNDLPYRRHKRVIYEALCFDVVQGRMNGAPSETRTHSCRFAS